MIKRILPILGVLLGIGYATHVQAQACTGPLSVTITGSTSGLPLTATASSTPVSCNAGNNGTATVTPAGGSPGSGYTYDWFGSPTGDGTATITGLTAGTYTVTVTDVNLCSTVTSVMVSQPTALSADITATDASGVANDMWICPGGSANLTGSGSGGTGGYTYTWDPNIGVGAGAHSVSPPSTTTYNLTITDANSCTAVAAKTITVNPALSTVITAYDASGYSNDMIVCPGGSATLDADPNGGTPGYTYAWDNSLAPQETNNVTPPATTTYNVTVTDTKGCTATAAKTITRNPALSAVIASTDASGVANDMIVCPGGSANLDANPTGGSPNYNYAWDNGLVGNTDMHTVTPVATTTYNVTITDNVGCTTTAAKTITVNPALSATIAATDASGVANDMIVCPGGSANLDADPSGGTSGYTYAWDNSLPANEMHTVAPPSTTTYNVTVTDANGCTATAAKTITVNPALSAVIAATDASGVANDMIVCPGGSANLDANPTGGTGPFTYAWDNTLPANETHTVTPPSTTTYNVTVTDANGCTATAAKTITVNPALSAVIAATDASGVANDMIVCPGGSANLDANPSGGTSGYTYAWDNSLPANETHVVTPPSTTTYNVTVTDANGCTATAAKTITVNPALSAVIAATDASGVANDMIVCPGGSANLDANPSGGTSGYTYAWDNSLPANETHVVTPPSTTTYNVTVTDANGCTATAAKTITVNPALSAAIAATDASGVANDMIVCPGGSANLDANPTGGTGPFTYAWDNTLPANETHTVTPPSTTTYNVTVTDANGCTATAAKTITVNPAITISSASVTSNYNGAHVSCATGQGTNNDGQITVVATGGTGTLEYSKDNGSNYQPTGVFSGLTAGSYTMVVRDANGCTASQVVTVVAPPAIVAGTCDQTNDLCQVSLGQIKVAASGGTGVLNITWTSMLIPPFTGPATGTPAGSAQPVPNTPGVGGFIIYSGLSGNTTYNFVVTDANGCHVP